MHGYYRGHRRNDVHTCRGLAGVNVPRLEGAALKKIGTIYINNKEGRVLIVEEAGDVTVISIDAWKAIYKKGEKVVERRDTSSATCP